MRCVSWFSAVLVLCVCGAELADCDGLDSQDKLPECIWQCRLKQLVRNTQNLITNQQWSNKEDEEKEEEEEGSWSFSVLLSAPSPPLSLEPGTRPQRSEDRPSYSMEHFRWGKPTGRKRRPVRVHATVSTGDEVHEGPSVEPPFLTLRRRQLENNEEREHKKNTDTKSGTKYRITHFRWSTPPVAKRYGGFMKPWSERSHKPLLTLLRNIITKNTQ